MNIYINPEKSPAAIQAKATGSPISGLRFKRGANLNLSVVILGSTSASKLRFGIKAKGDYEGALLAYAAADNGITEADGTRFELSLAVSSEALNEAFNVGSGNAATAASISAVAEFAWQENGAERLSDTINTTLLNDIIRLATEAPEAAAGEYPAPDLVATKSWVNQLKASAAKAGLVLLEADAIIEGDHTAVALTAAGTIAIPLATASESGTVILGTDTPITGRNVLPVGKDASGKLAVNACGLSAFDSAKKAGFLGTEEEWVASLKGEQGEQGIQGNPGKDADIDEIVKRAVSEVTTAGTETRHSFTTTGADNAEFYWCEMSSAHVPTGQLTSLAVQCRNAAGKSMTTAACYLGVWEMDDSGTPILLGVSSNAATQTVGQPTRWSFDSIPLSGRAIRICLLPTQEADWLAGNLCFGARVSPCADSCCMVLTTPQAYLPQIEFTYEATLPRFAHVDHVSDESLHITEEERTRWDEINPTNQDACMYAIFWSQDASGNPITLNEILTAEDWSFLFTMPSLLSGSFALPLGEYALLVCRGNDAWNGNDLMLASGSCLSKFNHARYFNFPFGQ